VTTWPLPLPGSSDVLGDCRPDEEDLDVLPDSPPSFVGWTAAELEVPGKVLAATNPITAVSAIEPATIRRVRLETRRSPSFRMTADR
jgi:hypothetical protein